MYQHPSWCIEQHHTDLQHRPVILCEYAHAMGNSGGCLHKYWKHFRDQELPRFQGGFIWDFVDQGLADKKEPNKYKYGGDFGEVPHSGNFCCNGLTNPHRIPFPDAYEAAALQGPTSITLITIAGTQGKKTYALDIHNNRDFMSLSDLKLRVIPKIHIQPLFPAMELSSFELTCGDVSAKTSKKFDITSELMQSLQQNFNKIMSEIVAESYITDIDKSIPILWIDVSVIKVANTSIWNDKDATLQRISLADTSFTHFLFEQLNISSFQPLRKQSERQRCDIDVQSHSDQFKVSWVNKSKGVEMELVFNKEQGVLTAWHERTGRNILSSPLDVCIYRAITDNDRGGSIFSYESAWKGVGYHQLQHKANCTKFFHKHFANGDVEVSIDFVLVPPISTQKGIEIPCTTTYLCHADTRRIDVTYSATPSEFLPPLPRLGVRFAIPTAFEQVSWFGLGPHEAYDDRRAAVYLDVFEEKVTNLHTHYVVPQENGRRAQPR